MVKVTKKGFVMPVMGFTGKTAMAFKEAYIAAFDAMAAYIAQLQQSLWQGAGAGRRGVHALAGLGCPGGCRRIHGPDGALGVGGCVEFSIIRGHVQRPVARVAGLSRFPHVGAGFIRAGALVEGEDGFGYAGAVVATPASTVSVAVAASAITST